MPTPLTLSAQLARARMAVFALFFTNGALYANLVPRFPKIKDVFGLSDSVYGITVSLLPLGAIIAGSAAGWAIRRFTSARTAVMGTMGIGLMLTLAGFIVMWRETMGDSPGIYGLIAYFACAICFFLGGALDAATDVGQNAHGLRVQRLMGRPIINNFHAGWSIGAMTGGIMGAGAIALGLPVGVHMAISAGIFFIVGLICLRFTLPGADPERGELDPILAGGAQDDAPVDGDDLPEMQVHTIHLGPWLVVAAVTVLTIAGMLVEDAGGTWSTLYMRDYLGAAPELASIAFIVLLGAQTIGRLTADRQMEILGNRKTVQVGALLVATGMGIAVIWPNISTTLIGMALAGFGCAGIVPIAYNAADDIPGLRPGTGLTVVTWLSRLSFLAAPPIVGFIIERTSLLTAMIVIPISGILAVICSFIIANEGGATSAQKSAPKEKVSLT
ncbi:MAG: MFS transporter [Actinomycetaceae bacterium]|nr:MFS transporter [Actinomycetaceae bacterium]